MRFATFATTIFAILLAPATFAQAGKYSADPFENCVRTKSKMKEDIVELFREAKRKGDLSGAEQKTFLALEKKNEARNFKATIKNGYSLAMCQQELRELEADKVLLTSMAVRDAGLTECHAKVDSLGAEIDALYDKAKAEKQLSLPDRKKLGSMIDAYWKLNTKAYKAGLSLVDCNKLVESRVKLKAELTAMMANVKKPTK